jgi:hypothetical protein
LIKQEPGIVQTNTLKPVNDEFLESVGNSSQQHQQELPQPQTASTAYDEFQKQQNLLLRQYQEQLEEQLLLRQQQFEQQLLSSQQQNNDEVLQSVIPLKPTEVVRIKTEPGAESTSETSNSSQVLVRKSGLENVTSPSVSCQSSEPKAGLEATSAFSSNDLSLLASINKTTVLSGLVREYIDLQRGILEIYQVGHSGLLREPIAGNFKLRKISGWLSFTVLYLDEGCLQLNKAIAALAHVKYIRLCCSNNFNNHILNSSFSVFFHTSHVWVSNEDGNPYGPPVRFLERKFTGSTLSQELPVGER